MPGESITMDEVKFNSIMPHRKHSGRDGLGLPLQPPKGKMTAIPQVGGLHHRYARLAAFHHQYVRL